MTHDVRDEVVDYVGKWSGRTELPAKQLVRWIGVGMSKFYDWRQRYGKVNEHNRLVPRDHWLEAWEREANPLHQLLGWQLRSPAPLANVIDHFIAHVVRHPAAV